MEIKINRILCRFWAIYDELCNDECYLINEREQILEAYKNKELYGLGIKDAIYLIDKI